MHILFAVGFILLGSIPAVAAEKVITLYFDGARVEVVTNSARGYAEVVLPPAVLPDSLRIKPGANVTIDRVEIVAVPAVKKQGLLLEKLRDREEQLEDRLKALTTREEIFIAAAKSQSAKAPRKSKSNPEPLTTIRQGTDFAIAQLEGVYQSRRKAEKELKLVQSRLETVKKTANIGGSIARIWLKGKGGKIKVGYMVSDLRWTPVYDFRLDREGEVRISVRGVVPPMDKGAAVVVIPALMTDNFAGRPVTLGSLSQPVISESTFPVENAIFAAASARPTLSFFTTNTSQGNLPPADVSCYYRGEYLGRFRFEGLPKGESKNIECGK